jgi:hypothetical protein
MNFVYEAFRSIDLPALSVLNTFADESIYSANLKKRKHKP